MKTTTVFDSTFLELPKNHTERGNITSINNLIEVPFDIQRVYYLYDLPGGVERGGHAHRELQQFIVAASGSFDLVLDDGKIKRTFHLNRPYNGVLLSAGLWRELKNFSSGSIVLVLASLPYDENDYIRNYEEFKKYKLNE